MSVLRKLSVVLVLAASSLAAGCGGLEYEAKGQAPATGAIAKIAGAANEDTRTTRLSLEVSFLQPPADLAPGGTGFVVWYRKSSGTPWQKLGSLAYDTETRHAELLDITVAETVFELIVSVESGEEVAAPSSVIVVSQPVDAG